MNAKYVRFECGFIVIFKSFRFVRFVILLVLTNAKTEIRTLHEKVLHRIGLTWNEKPEMCKETWRHSLKCFRNLFLLPYCMDVALQELGQSRPRIFSDSFFPKLPSMLSRSSDDILFVMFADFTLIILLFHIWLAASILEVTRLFSLHLL